MYYIKVMELEIKYQGKRVNSEKIEFIKRFITDHPNASRRFLSKKLCEVWNWRQANGHLKDMVCRGLLLQLERLGYIKLPPIKFRPNNPLADRSKPTKIDIDKTPIYDYDQIEIKQVRRTPHEKLYNGLIDGYHYLGYVYPIGEYLKYIFFTKGRPIGCICFSSAVRHIKCRDQFIGWSKSQREANLHLIAYNTRFLILPWVKIDCLASQLLSKIVKVLGNDWERYFNHPVYFVETFVDTERFRGTCYKAGNWIYLGKTTGRGKNDQTFRVNRSIKAVWGYPLSKNFREVLQDG
jgi:hypothetical protein